MCKIKKYFARGFCFVINKTLMIIFCGELYLSFVFSFVYIPRVESLYFDSYLFSSLHTTTDTFCLIASTAVFYYYYLMFFLWQYAMRFTQETCYVKHFFHCMMFREGLTFSFIFRIFSPVFYVYSRDTVMWKNQKIFYS